MARPKGSKNKKTLEKEQQEYNFDFMEGENKDNGTGQTRGKRTSNEPNTAGADSGSNGEGLTTSRNESGASANTSTGTSEGNTGSTNGVKTSILERIKSKREQGNSPVHHTEPSLSKADNGTDEGRTTDSDSGTESNNRNHAGADSGLDEREGIVTGSDGSLDDNSTPNQPTNGRIKPKGVILDLPKPIGSKEGNKPIEKDKEKEPLTQKQANSYLPQMKDALKTFFKYADKGIEKTAKKQDVHIWTSIDDEEIEILASTLVEGATRSPVLAGAVKGIATNHKRLQVGFILMPRFIETVKTYLPEFDAGGGLFGALRQR